VPLVAVLGLAWVLGAGVLAWFSSPSTLQLARGDQQLVTATIESRLFGLVTKSVERIEGIRSVSLVRSTESSQYDSNSHTPERVVFETTGGAVDLGRNQQLFAVDYPDIASFFKDEASKSLTLSSIARGRELRRFFVAQAATLFLALVGFGLEWMVVRSLTTRD
jgi:hypothetical protein